MRHALLALATTLALATPLAAQGAMRHDGFYFGLGGGVGWADYGGTSNADTRTGFAGHVRFGGHIRPGLLVGAETNGWYGSEEDVDFVWGTLMGTATWYPSRDLPLFLKGGAGYLITLAFEPSTDELESMHFAIQAGLGYDIPVGRNQAVTLTANWIQGFSSARSYGDIRVDDVSPLLIQLGVGFTIY